MISNLRLRLRRATSRRAGALGHPDSIATPQLRRQIIARRQITARRAKRGRNKESEATSPMAPESRLTQVESVEAEAQVRPLDFGLIWRVFAFMRPHRVKRNWLLLSVLVRAIQLPALAALLGFVINGPLANRDTQGMIKGAIGFLMLAAFTQLTQHFRSRLALEIGEAVVHDLRRDLFAHLQTMTMSYYQKTPLGRTIGRMTSDIETVRVLVQDVLFISLVALGQMLVAAAIMFWYDRVLFLMILALAPILWALNLYFRKRLSQAWRDAQESFSRVTSSLAESVSGIRVTQSFVRQEFNARLFLNLVVEHSNYSMAAARRSGALPPLLDLNNQLFMAGLLLLGGYRILGPGVSDAVSHTRAEALVSYYLMSANFFGPISMLGNLYNQSLTAMAGAERVFQLLDSKPEFSDDPGAQVLPPIKGRVEFCDLSFGYEPDQLVLRDINFTALPGQTIALVGHTGSGKSSLISLVSKFYLPTSGQLLIDGREIRKIQTQSLHQQMGIVSQVNFLFTGTVMENIRVGRPDASDEAVMEAARRLDVFDLIENMPQGFDTQVGERGDGISLGQRQIICFARVMLADPRIVILDEATSSVDTMTELRLQKALSALLEDRTSFVVAHRLSTIRHADKVLVLDQGRIVERGTHHQLLRAGKTYANLYRQFIRAGAA